MAKKKSAPVPRATKHIARLKALGSLSDIVLDWINNMTQETFVTLNEREQKIVNEGRRALDLNEFGHEIGVDLSDYHYAVFPTSEEYTEDSEDYSVSVTITHKKSGVRRMLDIDPENYCIDVRR